jgi:hypothetical protein
MRSGRTEGEAAARVATAMLMRRHPMVMFLYALATLSGLVFVVGAAPPRSVDQLLPGTLVWMWNLALLAGGGTGLAATLLRDPLTGLLVERSAMLPLAAAALAYTMALVALGNVTVVLSAGIILAFAAAAIWRAVQITRLVGGRRTFRHWWRERRRR